MERRSVGRLGAAAMAIALAACAGGQKQETAKAPEVNQDWLARVPPEGMAPVDEARAAQRQQEDEANRAAVARQDAENQVNVSKNEEKAAKAAVGTAEARVDAAKARGQYTEINEAKAALDNAKLASRVAEAKRQRDEKAAELARGQEALAKTRVDTARAQVSQAEYRALLATGDARAAELDPAAFDKAVSDRMARESRAQAQVDKQQQGYQAANATYDQLNQQLRASRPAPPAG